MGSLVTGVVKHGFDAGVTVQVQSLNRAGKVTLLAVKLPLAFARHSRPA